MPAARTTAALVKNAIEGAQRAGIAIGAVEVLPGGGVRILPPETVVGNAVQAQDGGNTCDEIFGRESD
jgi:hypothetical protein